MQVLALPERVLSPSGPDKFLWGMPVVGIDKRVYRSLRKIQQGRTAATLECWHCGESLLPVKNEIDDVLVRYFKWPNKYFLPEDRCNALFFYPYGDLQDAEGLMKIEDAYLFGNVFDRINSISYLEFLEILANRK